jgi:oxygen-independent coproporphyrinogen-3 oxidase
MNMQRSLRMDRFGIYVHIPFCVSKCKYCDFVSFPCMEKIDKYFDVLIKEIKSKNVYGTKEVTTIYIGGGTPSVPDSKYIVKIIETIKEVFKVSKNAEVTIEVNPGTVTKEKLIDYKNSGINRISIGLQSTNNEILKLIGRIHNYEEFLNTYNLAKEVGYNNINVDLMLGIPNQTESDVIDSINKVISLNPKHISIYSLIVEENTEIQRLIESGTLTMPSEEDERNMYWKTKTILEKNGFIQYEISNFAKKGYESKHNLDCWNQEEYIGMGLASHSYFNRKRFSIIDKLDKYIENENCLEKNIIINEVQGRESQAKEYMLIGLRKISGVSISKFEKKFRINPLFYFRFEINNLVEKGLIEVDLDNIKLTKKGLDFANIVFEEFV